MRDADDPRLANDLVRRVSSEEGTVTLVGVVHDHPASSFRARAVIEAVDPALVALELPPLSVPLYREFSRDSRVPPAKGGEMSAAIQAAHGAKVVGIDGPTFMFTVGMIDSLLRDRPSLATVIRVVRSFCTTSKNTIKYAIAGRLTRLTGSSMEVEQRVPHEVSLTDDAMTQATDEKRQIRRARAIMDAFEPATAVAYRDRIREEYMASRLRELRRDGDVVAIVGSGHLRSLVSALETP